MLIILLKSIAIYFIILIVLKFMGKREIGQLSLFDFVVILIIADLSVLGVESNTTPFFHTLVPVIGIAIIQKVISLILLKVPKIRNIFDGESSFIIVDGKLNIKEMKKQAYNIDDLIIQIRLKNIRSISEIRYLILEPNGEISVFRWVDFKDKTPPLSISVENKTHSANISTQIMDINPLDIYPFPVITSGVMNDHHLKILNISKEWIIHELKLKGYLDYKKILYANYEYHTLFVAETCDF